MNTTQPYLAIRRLPAPADDAAAVLPPHTLGAIGYGTADRAHRAGPFHPIHATLLLDSPPAWDAWLGGLPLASGQCGGVQWQHDANWVFGVVEFDETELGADLATLAERAYDDVFATLQSTGFAHLVRLWNYLPDINADAGGMERYRQFNIGRQKAFLKARRGVHEGAPAACALGTRGGRFSIRFVAGLRQPVPVENPRQVSAYHYPRDYGPRSPTFSRAALVELGADGVALLISGTASIVGHASVHPGDVRAQTRETVANLRAVIAAAHALTPARFALEDLACTVYVRHPADADTVRAALAESVGAASPALRTAVFLQADVCRSELLVEIEAHAAAARPSQ